MCVLGATVKDIVADLAHTDEFEDEIFGRREGRGCRVDTVLFDSLLARDLKSWERAGRTGSGRPSSRKMAGKPLTKSGISIIRGHLSDCTRDLPAGSQPTGTHVPVEILPGTGTGLYFCFAVFHSCVSKI